MRTRVLVFVAVVLGGFLGYVSMLPTEMRVSREIIVNATPDKLFPYINNAKKMDEWMPWQESDPSVKIEYSGPEEGVGSHSSWTSTGDMGVGTATILESNLNQSVKTELKYTKPMAMVQMAELALAAVDGGTKVTWSIVGQKNFVFKFMGVFWDCDKMIGGEFEKGLAKLKTMAEKT